MRRNLLRAEWAGLACAWPVAAWAYTRAEAFGAELAAIPLEALGYAALLALLGGLASTLRKIANPDAPLRSVGLEVAKDLSTSLVAGLMAFWVGGAMELRAMELAGTITIAGWMGARLLDRAADGVLDRLFPGREESDRRTGFDRREE